MTLPEFLTSWDERNLAAHCEIDLFQPEKSGQLTREQRIYFAKIFYHARGHFHDFLWFMGSHAPNHAQKKKIIDNITEEFGGSRSHEELYIDFATSLGADLTRELVQGENYLPWLRDFNRGHLEYLQAHDWDGRLAAFLAYERLDNVDYQDLLRLVESFGVTDPNGLMFFKVHSLVHHFDMANKGDLERIWAARPDVVTDAFDFIAEHQNRMWRRLSEEVFAR